MIVQTPPTIPTALIGYLACKWHRSKYVIDWHNLGYSVLAQKFEIPLLISIYKGIEVIAMRLADHNLAVSMAEKDWIQINGGASAVVLYDRPNPKMFVKLDGKDRANFRCRIRERLGWDAEDDASIIVTSTSWTPDEDFAVLVDAIRDIRGRFQLLITGKGPLKTFYERKIIEAIPKEGQFGTCWLSFEDYAKLLGSADLGLCLHTSSSGVDLPMKAYDMIGAQLPLLAADYPAIREIFTDDRVLFTNSGELSRGVNDFFQGKLKVDLPKLQNWSAHWKKVMRQDLGL